MKLAAFAAMMAIVGTASFFLAKEPVKSAEPLVVHEWGTFTSLQDETGRAIGGINTDDEPVPGFVHRVGNLIGRSNNFAAYAQGIPSGDPQVTMRLETPVLYFYRAPSQPVETVNVDVAFSGGWLTEFFPNATSSLPGVTPKPSETGEYTYGPLTAQTTGRLSWSNVQVGKSGSWPETGERVWTIPRTANSDLVTVGEESEKFLFYRGVGHIDAPLSLESSRSGHQIKIHLQVGLSIQIAAELAHAPMWLVRVNQDGQVAWIRGYSPVDSRSGSVLGVMDTRFEEHHSAGLASLHKDMSAALKKAGLSTAEAEAMLNTWEVSYFKSPGLRLFFIVPRGWVDAKLPLRISGNPPTTRVMVGRIEIISPEQRSLIELIESGPFPRSPRAVDPREVEQRLADGEPMAQAVSNFPPDFRAYVLLGRFRDALLTDEQARYPNPVLAKFLAANDIVAQRVH